MNDLQVINVKNAVSDRNVAIRPKYEPESISQLPKPHFLWGLFGIVRSGKTYSMVSALLEFMKYAIFTHYFLICPSYASNEVFHQIPFHTGGIYTNPSTGEMDLERVLHKIDWLANMYESETKYAKIYAKEKRGVNLTYDERLLFNDMEGRPPDPRYLTKPVPILVIDDMIGTTLMGNHPTNPLNNLAMHHRHIARGTGVSIMMGLQKFKNGMPRMIRPNLSVVSLFATCDLSEIEEMWREVANGITLKKFKELFFFATVEPHSFFFIDNTVKDLKHKYGICFHKKYVVDPVEERRVLLLGDGANKPKRELCVGESDEERPTRVREHRRKRKKIKQD